MRGLPITAEEIQRALDLHASGMQWREIGLALNRSPSYLHKLAKHGEQARIKAAKRARENRPRYVYGLSAEDLAELLARQDGKCPICRCELTEANMHIDHDHQTGKVRGILCRKHNNGLGMFDEDPALLRAAADYIECARIMEAS